MVQKSETRENTQTKNEESSNSFLLGALVGGLVGAAAALVFSPKSGKDLREFINTGALLEKTGQIKESVVNKGSELISKTSSMSQNLVQQSAEFLNKSKDARQSEGESETKTQYIPLGETAAEETTTTSMEDNSSEDPSDVRKKLEEAKKAFDEEENKVKQ